MKERKVCSFDYTNNEDYWTAADIEKDTVTDDEILWCNYNKWNKPPALFQGRAVFLILITLPTVHIFKIVSEF